MKWYQAVRIAEEVSPFSENATLLLDSTLHVLLFGALSKHIIKISKKTTVKSNGRMIREKLKKNYIGGGRSWLRHCATSRKIVGSIPDRVVDGIFN